MEKSKFVRAQMARTNTHELDARMNFMIYGITGKKAVYSSYSLSYYYTSPKGL